MNFLGRLFGSDNAIKKAADGIYNGVDQAFFTNQEKAQHFLDLLKAYEPFKLAQRFLALTVTVPYVLTWLLSALMLFISAFVDPEAGKRIEESARVLGELNNDTLGVPVSLVLAFYFGGGAVEGVVSRMAGRNKTER
jgi:hypothetical protein